LKRDTGAKIWSKISINVDQPLDPDLDKPRFLPYCDGFDYVEGVFKSRVAAIFEGKGRINLSQVDAAFYKAHNSEDGFKKHLMKDPEKYGINPNPALKDFLTGLREFGYVVFLLTSSPQKYTERILEALDITDCFDLTMTGAKKPACFSTERSENAELMEQLHSVGIESPDQVFYMGDHLYKDIILARQLGFMTGLRMQSKDIAKVTRKLTKYGGIEFETRNGLSIPTNGQKVSPSELANVVAQLYSHVHLLAKKPENLGPFLLYS